MSFSADQFVNAEREMTAEEREFVTKYVEGVLQKASEAIQEESPPETKPERTLRVDEEFQSSKRPFLTHVSSIMVLRTRLQTLGKAMGALRYMKKKQDTKPRKFLYYDKGIGVFINKIGKEVDATGKTIGENTVIPGSPYEMAKMRLSSFRHRALSRPTGPKDRPLCQQCPTDFMDLVKAMYTIEQPPINEEVFSAWTDAGRTVPHGGVEQSRGCASRPKKPKAKFPGNSMDQSEKNYQIIYQNKKKRVMLPATALIARGLEPKTDAWTPTNTKEDVENKTVSVCPITQFVFPTPHWTQRPNTPTSRIKTFAFDSLDQRGVKGVRPVRGFRTQRETPVRTDRPGKTNREGTNISTDQIDGDQSQAENNRWAAKVPLAFQEPLQLIHHDGREEHNQIYMLMKAAHRNQETRMNREPVSMRTVSLPRKGRIKLTALPYELDNPDYFDDRREAAERKECIARYQEQLLGPALPSPSPDPLKGTLIRNRTILKQVKSDVKRLEQDLEQRQTRNHPEGHNSPSLVGDILEYQISEVPHINSNLHNFVNVQSSNNNHNHKTATTTITTINNGATYTNNTSNNGFKSEGCPDTARSLPEMASSIHTTSGTVTTPRKSFEEVIRKMESCNNNTTMECHTAFSSPFSGLWQMLDTDKVSIPGESTPQSPLFKHHDAEGLSLHCIIKNAQKIACSRLKDEQKNSKALSFPVIDLNNTQKY